MPVQLYSWSALITSNWLYIEYQKDNSAATF